MLTPADTIASSLLLSGENKKGILLNDAPDVLWKWSKEVYFQERMEKLGV